MSWRTALSALCFIVVGYCVFGLLSLVFSFLGFYSESILGFLVVALRWSLFLGSVYLLVRSTASYVIEHIPSIAFDGSETEVSIAFGIVLYLYLLVISILYYCTVGIGVMPFFGTVVRFHLLFGWIPVVCAGGGILLSTWCNRRYKRDDTSDRLDQYINTFYSYSETLKDLENQFSTLENRVEVLDIYTFYPVLTLEIIDSIKESTARLWQELVLAHAVVKDGLHYYRLYKKRLKNKTISDGSFTVQNEPPMQELTRQIEAFESALDLFDDINSLQQCLEHSLNNSVFLHGLYYFTQDKHSIRYWTELEFGSNHNIESRFYEYSDAVQKHLTFLHSCSTELSSRCPCDISFSNTLFTEYLVAHKKLYAKGFTHIESLVWDSNRLHQTITYAEHWIKTHLLDIAEEIKRFQSVQQKYHHRLHKDLF